MYPALVSRTNIVWQHAYSNVILSLLGQQRVEMRVAGY